MGVPQPVGVDPLLDPDPGRQAGWHDPRPRLAASQGAWAWRTSTQPYRRQEESNAANET
jgi:hypothetical protein